MAHIFCNNCHYKFKSPDVVYYSSACSPRVHVFCSDCINKFRGLNQIECRLCNQQHSMDNITLSELPSTPWNPQNQLCMVSMTPAQIMQNTNSALQWWNQQQQLRVEQATAKAMQYAKQLQKQKDDQKKEMSKLRVQLEQQYKVQLQSLSSKNNQLKLQNNQLKLQNNQLKNCVQKYKHQCQNVKGTAQSLQKENVEKTRRFNNLNAKYNALMSKISKQRNRNKNKNKSTSQSLYLDNNNEYNHNYHGHNRHQTNRNPLQSNNNRPSSTMGHGNNGMSAFGYKHRI